MDLLQAAKRFQREGHKRLTEVNDIAREIETSLEQA